MHKETMGAVHTAWNWKPDAKTVKAIADGNRKIKLATSPPKPKQENHMETQMSNVSKVHAGTRMATRKRSKTPVKAAPKTATTTKVSDDPSLVALKQLCGKDIEPRDARRLLRKANIQGHDSRDRWTFKKGSPAHEAAKAAIAPLRKN